MHRFVCLTALCLLATSRLAAQDSTALLSLERIFTKRDFAFAPLPNIIWLADGRSYIDLRPGEGGGTDIARVDAVTGRVTIVVGAADLTVSGKRLEIEEIALSRDESKALLFHSSVPVWRSNTRGLYHVVDFRTRQLTPVSAKPGLQMFAKFSPDGRQVGFVRDNDLFVTDLGTGEDRQLTTDGSDVIINGTTDWVYEEELGLRDAFRWSPDSKRMAYWRFDQSAVPAFPMVDELSLYPRVMPLRYPKAGQPNARVRVGVMDVASRQTRWIDVGADTGVYLARMEWAGNDSVVIQRLPRRQNAVDVLMASATSGRTRLVLSDRDPAWVEVDDQPVWLAGERQFLWASERSGWRQIYLYNRNGSLVRQVTRDGADVSTLSHVDVIRDEIYVVEAWPTPMERQVFRYSLKDGKRTRVTQTPGTHRISVAPGSRYLVDFHGTAALPAVAVLHDIPSMKHRRVIADNAQARGRLTRLTARAPSFMRIPLANGDSLNASRIVPPGFDSTKKKYPVLMYVYGGPGSQTVTDDYGGDRYLWHLLLAHKGYIVVSVDNRGTGGRGSRFRKLTYLNLGKYETEDQITAARWLARQSWVDGSRIGIWGWSYGGYMSALAAGKGGDIFKAAIAIAPVSDWGLYDTIYTERYMWIPQENPEGYRQGAPLTHVKGMTASFLLVHGTGDDNVHPQNSIQLANALQRSGKQFQLMLYPNRTHSITGGNTRAHLYEMMTRFVEENL